MQHPNCIFLKQNIPDTMQTQIIPLQNVSKSISFCFSVDLIYCPTSLLVFSCSYLSIVYFAHHQYYQHYNPTLFSLFYDRPFFLHTMCLLSFTKLLLKVPVTFNKGISLCTHPVLANPLVPGVL